jgi:hypothetical protein
MGGACGMHDGEENTKVDEANEDTYPRTNCKNIKRREILSPRKMLKENLETNTGIKCQVREREREKKSRQIQMHGFQAGVQL